MKALTRRHVLRGAGVALALPWLESLAPRRARGQTAAAPLRFVPIYFPLGTASFWFPEAPGAGDAWRLSPILAPLAPVKSHVTVLGHVSQTAYGPTGIEPSNGFLTASYLTSARAQGSMQSGHPNGVNGLSLDQRLAQAHAGATPLPSLQVGLSTLDSYCDGAPCAFSRSISWSDPTTPLFKLVDPQAVFDKIVGGATALDPAAAKRRAARKSVLDFVLGDATSLSARLGKTDRARMDEFLTATRDLERRVAGVAAGAACAPVARPAWSANVGTSAVPPDYSRDTHANVMIDLIVMALSCDVTRVVSFMLDDARSDFAYTFLPMRHFTATDSTPGTGTCVGSPVGFANAGNSNDGWATITWWYVSKLALLLDKLAAIPDGADATLLDNALVWFGSPQQGEGFINKLPVLYAGGGGGWLKTDRFIDFPSSQSLANLYLTFLRFPFQLADATFGDSTGVVPEILV